MILGITAYNNHSMQIGCIMSEYLLNLTISLLNFNNQSSISPMKCLRFVYQRESVEDNNSIFNSHEINYMPANWR